MANTTTDFIRTAALVGHGGAGKTTLAEALLHAAGTIASPGTVEKGNTVCDFDPLSKEYGHSLNSSIVGWTRHDVRVHLIDTPGYPDFAGPAISALAALETALVAVNAQTGIELSTERMMRCRECRPSQRRRAHSGGVRQGVPSDQPACRRCHAGRGLLLQAGRRCGFLVGRGSSLQAGRSGCRG